MEREERIRRSGLEPDARCNPGSRPSWARHLQGVDHDVAHEVDFALGDALAVQVRTSALLRHEEQVGNRVGDDAVDLFRHRAVKTPQPRLHMRDSNTELDRRQGSGHGRIDVTDDHNNVRLAVL